jgi:lipopolysaccharide exporter
MTILDKKIEIQDKPVTTPLRAGGWATATYIITAIAMALLYIPLARLLTPADFGLYTLANVFASGIIVIVDLSLVRSIVRAEGDLEDILQAGWRLSIGVGIAGMILCAALGYPLALFFNRSEVLPIMLLISPAVLAAGLGAVPNAILSRELDFRRKLIPDTLSAIITSTLAIGLAFLGAGVFSLIVYVLAKPISGAIIAWIIVGWKPRKQKPNPITLKKLLYFALPASGGEALLYLRFNVDYLIIGRVLGTDTLGVYNLAWNTSDRPAMFINSFFNQVGYASFSHLQEARENLRRLYLSATRLIACVTIPIYLVAILIRSDLILGILGEKWRGTIELLLPFFILQMLWVVTYPSVSLVLALGHSRLYAICNAASLLVTITAVIIGSGFGAVGVAWAMLVAVGTFSMLWLILAWYFLRLNLQDFLYVFSIPLILAAPPVLGVLLLQFGTSGMSELLRLGLLVADAGFILLGAIWLGWKWIWQDILLLRARL